MGNTMTEMPDVVANALIDLVNTLEASPMDIDGENLRATMAWFDEVGIWLGD